MLMARVHLTILSSEMFTAIEIDITRGNFERQSGTKRDVKRGYRFSKVKGQAERQEQGT